CRSPKDSRRNGATEPQRRTVPVETSAYNALVSQCDGVGSYDWSYQTEEEPANFALMAFQLRALLLILRDTALVTLRKKLEKAEQERDDLKLKLEKFQTSSKNLTELLASQKNEKHGLGYNSQVFPREMFDCENYFSSESDCESCPPSSLYDRLQPSGGYHALSPSKPAQDLSYTNRPTAPIIEDWVSDYEDESKTKVPRIVPSFVQSSEQVKTPRHSILPSSEQVKTPRHSILPVETSIPAATPKPTRPKSNSSGKRRNRKTCFVCKSVDHLIKDCDYHAKIMAQPTPKNYAHRDQVTAVQAPVVSAAHGNMSYLSEFKELNGGYVGFGGNPKGGKIYGKGKIKTGKFKGKVDEGFLVGYSVNSKAFRVFNSRTRIVQETLHVNFLENKPNITGSGPTWLFDIDSLTRTMNYQPVIAGNQTNPGAGFQDKFNTEKTGKEIDQQYVLFPMCPSGFINPQNNDEDDAFDEKEHDAKKPEFEVNVSSSRSAQSRKQDDKTKKEAKGKSLVESSIRYRHLSAEFEDCSENSS
nr:ribonuclease H-like domain-containing protein [Tanacetum cinerariifolium]